MTGYWQWQATQAAVALSRESNELTRQAMRAVLVLIETIPPATFNAEKPIEVRFKFKNTGQTVARKVLLDTQGVVVSADPEIPGTETVIPNSGRIGTGEEETIGAGVEHELVIRFPLVVAAASEVGPRVVLGARRPDFPLTPASELR